MSGTTSCRLLIKGRRQMKRLAGIFLLLIVVGLLALPAFAQTPEGAKPPEHVAVGMVLAAGFSMAIAAAFCGLDRRAALRPPARALRGTRQRAARSGQP